ncbi:peptide deformylase 1B, chloroplastic/mitochondrial [Selaginella moellendorffii]|uniref:peptide deformylase 1B, chloroplastic/mitochondrial n=1 Tax=Selaginella moellendorffii TaxID=88036 RepID=UPI000D1CB52B|nr:peptide deformylase 1B, chloroplastic/mitochondrial [Selaginella moellendorffii]|eukprot:XP_024527321.1 peptide deformylase 1B, chloroplastic/mitochondrial [Selaginella moellendorffii]
MCRRVAEIRGAIECSEWIPGSTIEIECGHIPATAAAARISSDNGSYTTVHREWKPMVKLRAGPVDINSNLSFVLYPDPKLRARNIRINSFDDNVKKLMLDVTYRRDGVGLSTPRLGKGKGYVFLNGKKFGTTFRGWTARIFRHEYDHLEGVLYIDQMTPKALNSIGQELLNLEEEFEKRSGTPRPDVVKDKLLSLIPVVSCEDARFDYALRFQLTGNFS